MSPLHYFSHTIIKPLLVAGLIVWALFGTQRGTAVRDDYTWFLGIIVALWLIYSEVRLTALQQRIQELENKEESSKTT